MRSRRRPREETSQDHDSFLDIVANMVGILIILVMIVSVRAKDAPTASPQDALPAIDIAGPQRTAHALHAGVVRTAQEIRDLDATLAARRQQRQSMSIVLAAVQSELADRRAAMNDHDRHAYDLEHNLASLKRRLEQTDLERIRASMVRPKVVQIDNVPTPISKSVVGREVHFQLRNGRIAHVPIQDLFAEAKAQAREKIWKLDNLPEVTELVGPRAGFRMRYTLEKVELPLAVRMKTGRAGFMIRSKRWEIIPTQSQLGEPIDVALQPGSVLHQVVAGLKPGSDTVTVWVYPDSFDALRSLKKRLYEQGISTAARPLPEGTAIAGSPNGSRSQAQ